MTLSKEHSERLGNLRTAEGVAFRILSGIFERESEPLEEIAAETVALSDWPASGFTFRLNGGERFAVTVVQIDYATDGN